MNIVFRDRPFHRRRALVLGLSFGISKPLGFLIADSRFLFRFELALIERRKILDRDLVTAIDGFVADDDAVDVSVVLGEIDRGLDFALVAVVVLVDPDADGDLQAELGGNGRHQFIAFGRGVEADRSRQGGELLQIGANLLGVGDAVGDRVTRFKRRIGRARQNAPEIGRRLLLLE